MFRRSFIISFVTLLIMCLSVSCKDTNNRQSSPGTQSRETKTGLASFYGQAFQGQETASGETFNKNELVAAHPTYPTGTKVRVTNLANEQTVEVRIIDRGPTQENQAEGVIIDLSKAAASQLDMVKDGRAQVKIEVLEWGSNGQQ